MNTLKMPGLTAEVSIYTNTQLAATTFEWRFRTAPQSRASLWDGAQRPPPTRAVRSDGSYQGGT